MSRPAFQRTAFSAVCLFLALALILGAPGSARASKDIYFVAIDDTLPFELSSSTMPFWDGGALYVPYTAFDSSTLGVYASLDRSEWILSIYNSNHQLDFYINLMASYDGSGNYYEYKALMRNSTVFVPVGFVCAFFGLGCSYITQGTSSPVVRITSGKQVYSDTTFITQAAAIISTRTQNYLGSSVPTPPVSSPVVPPSPSVSLPPDNSDITVALWVDVTGE
ncbi:MAG: hypothetical protein IKM51_04895, partial [Oscillospiraceae bacterium]|nr:hypothetical protein [Oscillospiraceae bacterium]